MNTKTLIGKLATAALMFGAGVTIALAATSSTSSLALSSNAQLNDLSILLPLPKDDADRNQNYLAAESVGSAGILLPRNYLDNELADVALTGLAVNQPYENLRLLAVRLDPCFGQIGPITDPTACQFQLRAVFQAVAPGGGSAVDGGVHVFYRLSKDEWRGALDDIIKLRQANAGDADLGPLAVHPVIAKQGMGGAMGQGLNRIILKYGGAGRLQRITKFSVGNFGSEWSFYGINIDGGRSSPLAIGSLGNTFLQYLAVTLVNEYFNATFTPSSGGTNDIRALADFTGAITDTDRKQAFDGALRLDNPNFVSPNTADCASCHVAENARAFNGGFYGLSDKGNVNKFVADARYVIPGDVAETPNPDNLNVHAFSYRNSVVRVNQRVVNETAAILAYVNGLSGLVAP